MGQKTNPLLQRIGYIYQNKSNWIAPRRKYAGQLHKDIELYEFLYKKYKAAGISDVRIERPAENARVVIHAAKPGLLIGRKGQDIEVIKEEAAGILGVKVHVSVEEIKHPELIAKLVAESIALQLEKRVQFRKAMKRAVQSAMKSSAKGIKVCVSGRLGGAEIARSEWYREGRVPLHTFRADIDYDVALSHTTYGIIGVKVWIYKGNVLVNSKSNTEENEK